MTSTDGHLEWLVFIPCFKGNFYLRKESFGFSSNSSQYMIKPEIDSPPFVININYLPQQGVLFELFMTSRIFAKKLVTNID